MEGEAQYCVLPISKVISSEYLMHAQSQAHKTQIDMFVELSHQPLYVFIFGNYIKDNFV